ncbi:hypothetical protein PPL_01986 [Heterostelium album PN500]|uniref:Uncharacterized protein n=1 Tax=Heterostelium pallidum (strain ATCC 26659 / Pp 5 / PN500) TaxID=670386 RepID=D3B118_HETP5|nr:hypothetical protein PPL_01986 [Heterostelium album PN500]EFA84992.1 hypothetical protein PPL_01986 [Heterostelium album PN500]|eukprot:XP_020437102.1 hypothetical protein PPL_01986 [Heterostelium album PN500]
MSTTTTSAVGVGSTNKTTSSTTATSNSTTTKTTPSSPPTPTTLTKEKKTIEEMPGFFPSTFKSNTIQIINYSNEALVALIKMDPNAHYYSEVSLGLGSNSSTTNSAISSLGGISGTLKKDVKQTAPIQRINLRVENKTHDIDIDGSKAYVSVFKLGQTGDHYLGVIEDRLVKKGKVLNINQNHITDLTTPGFNITHYDLLFNKMITPSSSSPQLSSTNSTPNTSNSP